MTNQCVFCSLATALLILFSACSPSPMTEDQAKQFVLDNLTDHLKTSMGINAAVEAIQQFPALRTVDPKELGPQIARTMTTELQHPELMGDRYYSVEITYNFSTQHPTGPLSGTIRGTATVSLNGDYFSHFYHGTSITRTR